MDANEAREQLQKLKRWTQALVGAAAEAGAEQRRDDFRKDIEAIDVALDALKAVERYRVIWSELAREGIIT